MKAKLVTESKGGVLVAVGDKGKWLPRKLVSFDEFARIGEMVEVTMPGWLARKEGLAGGAGTGNGEGKKGRES